MLFGFGTFNVLGAEFEGVIENWDSTGYIVGDTEGENSYVTWENTGDANGFEIVNSYLISSPNYIRSNCVDNTANEEDTLHITLKSDYSYIGGFSIRCSYPTQDPYYTNDAVYVLFDFLNDSGSHIMQIRLYDKGTLYAQYRDYEGTWHDIVSAKTNIWFNFTHLYNNIFNYSVYDCDTGISYYEENTCFLSGVAWESFKYLNIYNFAYSGGSSDTMASDIRIDDLVIGTSNPESESEYGDVDQYLSFCHGSHSLYISDTYKYIEQKFSAPIEGTVHAVDLFVSSEQINYVSSTLSDYNGNLNNVPLGSPTYIVPNGNDYILRWYGKSISLDNEYPLLEFKSDKYRTLGSINYYWFNYAINWDGYGGLRHHNNVGQFGDNLFNGDKRSEGLGACIYFTKTGDYKQDYEDTIYTLPKEQDEYQEYENIFISYTLSTDSGNSYIQLWFDSDDSGDYETKYEGQNFDGNGYYVESSSGTVTFVPTINHNGSWQCLIYRGGENITYHNFTVINRNDLDYNGQIWTTPNPTQPNQQFLIGWIYNYTYYENYGAILISDSPYLKSGYGVVKDHIQDFGQTYFSYDKLGAIFFYLCENENGVYKVIDRVQHYIGGYFGNEIHVSKQLYQLDTYVEFGDYYKAIAHIYGTHSYLNQEVYVLVNDGEVLKYNIGQNNKFDLELDVIKTGYYDVKLIVYSSSTTYNTLDSTYFIVGEYEESSTTEYGIDIFYIIRNASPIVRLIVAVVICIFGLMSPYIILSKLKLLGTTEVSQFAPVAGFGLGVVIATLIGCWGWEIMFFLLALMVMATLIIIYIKKNGA